MQSINAFGLCAGHLDELQSNPKIQPLERIRELEEQIILRDFEVLSCRTVFILNEIDFHLKFTSVFIIIIHINNCF